MRDEERDQERDEERDEIREFRLADHIVFRELPFCGVLLDTRKFTVHRLSQRAGHVLRTALETGAPNPYAPLLPDGDEDTAHRLRHQLLDRLVASGMVRRARKERR
ncbi:MULTISPECIES: actinodefensin-associated protein B [unclassified Streptomyces]|uniref:actinodefensin-associated protein B n=1 Tax=unclassified Streptomyces TaxID=2593676 RepID=UPI002366186B|nr:MULTISPECIES: actinodefensin-associated protein B [unclassified Streptomyces]MDF3145383.1 actinodefensin-associated protein B [Streptomyces sp. T21Q-yed]WDF39822.1 actinodefensin-associated protein B [Streptomyces sp. T12]